MFACNMDQCFRISIGGPLDDDVLIAFLIDWLLAMFAKNYFRHFSIVLYGSSELAGESAIFLVSNEYHIE